MTHVKSETHVTAGVMGIIPGTTAAAVEAFRHGGELKGDVELWPQVGVQGGNTVMVPVVCVRAHARGRVSARVPQGGVSRA